MQFYKVLILLAIVCQIVVAKPGYRRDPSTSTVTGSYSSVSTIFPSTVSSDSTASSVFPSSVTTSTSPPNPPTTTTSSTQTSTSTTSRNAAAGLYAPSFVLVGALVLTNIFFALF